MTVILQWHGGFLRPILHCFKEIWVTPKTSVLPSGTWLQTLDLENLAGKYISEMTNFVSSG